MLASLDLGHVEHVVDQRQEVLAAGQDVARVLGVAPVADLAEHLGRHHLRKSDDGVQRRA